MQIRLGPGPSAAFDRHQGRRDSGVPTLSVLAGPVDAGRRWAVERGRLVVEVSDPRIEAIAGAVVDRLAAGRDLVLDGVSRLARVRGTPGGELGPRIARMSRVELGLFLDARLDGDDPEGVDAACRWVLERAADGLPIAGPGLAVGLGSSIASRTGAGPSERALGALLGLIPPGSAPVLIAARAPDTPEPSRWLESMARSLGRLALDRPGLPTILAVEPAELDDYLRLAPESREKALVRAGIVEVKPPSEPPAHDPPEAPDPDDRARSEAERFLFEQLEARPTTAGLFAMNATLDIPFGPPGRLMEVDLVSVDLKIVIEIDGYYHFQGPDSYRRDRRKDFLLQARDFRVLRVLAEDVVSRLEEILGQIHQMVASRRGTADPSNRDTTR